MYAPVLELSTSPSPQIRGSRCRISECLGGCPPPRSIYVHTVRILKELYGLTTHILLAPGLDIGAVSYGKQPAGL